jgi:mono/diheme cytochrome c family protein
MVAILSGARVKAELVFTTFLLPLSQLLKPCRGGLDMYGRLSVSSPVRLRQPAAFLLSGALGFGLVCQPPAGGVFTKAQADAGRAIYLERCAGCHTADLGGREDAPALAGDGFLSAWSSKTTRDLFEFVRDTMPPDGPTLAPEIALDVVAHILRENGAAAGPAPLGAATAAGIGSIATGRRPPVSSGSRPRGRFAGANMPHATMCTSRTSAC